MMGGGQMDADEMQDRFEQTKTVIEEVDKQFKNPVRLSFHPQSSCRSSDGAPIGHDDICVRVYPRVPVRVRDGAFGARAYQVPH